MNKVFVINASPIILLGKAGLLTTISPLAESWIFPEGVVAEVEAKRPIDSYLCELAGTSNVSRESVEAINPLVAAWDLGRPLRLRYVKPFLSGLIHNAPDVFGVAVKKLEGGSRTRTLLGCPLGCCLPCNPAVWI